MTSDANGVATNDGIGVLMIVLSEVLLALVNTIVKYVHDWSTQKMMLIRNSRFLFMHRVVLKIWA